jgi:hypothetical protein
MFVLACSWTATMVVAMPVLVAAGRRYLRERFAGWAARP